jgi:hypothetical protein
MTWTSPRPNGSPMRAQTSTSPELMRVVNKHKAKVLLSVDAHSTKELENLHYAVGTARRGVDGDVPGGKCPLRRRIPQDAVRPVNRGGISGSGLPGYNAAA